MLSHLNKVKQMHNTVNPQELTSIQATFPEICNNVGLLAMDPIVNKA